MMAPAKVAISGAKKELSALARFAGWFRNRDDERLSERLAAISAVRDAAIATRVHMRSREGHVAAAHEKPKSEGEISELWGAAAERVAQFDPDLSYECQVKAYGWGAGVWEDPAFRLVARRDEEVLAEAMEFLRK